jgi:hypothetical protein
VDPHTPLVIIESDDADCFQMALDKFYELTNKRSDIDIDLQIVIIKNKIFEYTEQQLDLYNSAAQVESFKPFRIEYLDGSIEKISHNAFTNASYKNWLCNAGKEVANKLSLPNTIQQKDVMIEGSWLTSDINSAQVGFRART